MHTTSPETNERPTRRLSDIYRHLHAHPELSFQEEETAALVADELEAAGFEVTTDVGGTGVVGVLRNGAGATALLRADMDALPVLERTGLDYASVATTIDRDGATIPVMHACGHDVHVTCLLGAARELSSDRSRWNGTLVVVFQPAEEIGRGAQAMVDDGLFERFPVPDVVLGQHVAPLPAGYLALRSGTAFAASDSIRVTLFGRGGHGSRPETTVDPVVLASSTVLRLQTIVSREISATESAVVTVGSLRAGTKDNVIPDSAELLLSIRSFDPGVRDRVLAAVRRIVAGEAAAAGAPREPLVELVESFPSVVNSPDATARTRGALSSVVGTGRIVEPGAVTGSEDVGILASAAGAACVYWLLGGADPAEFAEARDRDALVDVVRRLPSNHSPMFAPVIEPTLTTGVGALVAAAHAWLPRSGA